MTTRVVILAQGTQKRMGPSVGYKQLLPLPACRGVPIMGRTIRQVQKICPAAQISVVGWHSMHADTPPWMSSAGGIFWTELRDPGNSSLKGVARYLERFEARVDAAAPDEQILILLGDVVYSWACLEALFAASTAHGFVGSSNLTAAGGEIWGVAWHRAHDNLMLSALRDALLRHPPIVEDYQPGQLRRWLMGYRRGDLAERVEKLRKAGSYVAIDDYTMDVDLPNHILLLAAASTAAAADDLQHGLHHDP